MIPFERLEDSKLVVDEIYCGGSNPNMSSEVLNKLMLCSNSGGFRQVKNKDGDYAYCVLYTTGEDVDWKDYLDAEVGRFVYYGDNKTEGHSLHNTSRKGNEILRTCFERLEEKQYDSIIPFFVFKKEKGRDVRFLGLVVPGDDRLTKEEQLISVWYQKDGKRYQNYRAVFSVLETEIIDRRWLYDLKNSVKNSKYEPESWKKWIKSGKCNHLISQKVVEYRTKEEQIPQLESDKKIIKEIYKYFDDPYKFELCAAKLAQMMDGNIVSYDLTRTRRDGGRDAIGKYRIGIANSNIQVEFAIEAKRYDINNGVGVKETSRLISRLKHREFGILITTSYVDMQTYKEIVEDSHPIIILSAVDIIEILKRSGIKTLKEVKEWLNCNF